MLNSSGPLREMAMSMHSRYLLLHYEQLSLVTSTCDIIIHQDKPSPCPTPSSIKFNITLRSLSQIDSKRPSQRPPPKSNGMARAPSFPCTYPPKTAARINFVYDGVIHVHIPWFRRLLGCAFRQVSASFLLSGCNSAKIWCPW